MYISAWGGSNLQNFYSFDPAKNTVTTVFNISTYLTSTSGTSVSNINGIIPYKGSLLFSYGYIHVPTAVYSTSVVAIDDHGTVVPVLDGLDRVQSTTNIAGDTFVFTDNGLIEFVEETLVLAE